MSETEFVVCTSKIPGAMKELARLLEKEFGLKEEDIKVHLSHTDSVSLVMTKENFDKVPLDQIRSYCSGFVDALDITEYLTTEYLNDR